MDFGGFGRILDDFGGFAKNCAKNHQMHVFMLFLAKTVRTDERTTDDKRQTNKHPERRPSLYHPEFKIMRPSAAIKI